MNQTQLQEECPFISSGMQISVSLDNKILTISPETLTRLNIRLDDWIGKDIETLISCMTDRDGVIEPCELTAKPDDEVQTPQPSKLELMVCRLLTESNRIYYLQDFSQEKFIYNSALRSPIPISNIRKIPPVTPDYILDSQYILKDSMCLKLDPLGVVESTYPFTSFMGVKAEAMIKMPITAYIDPEDHVLLMQSWSESLKSNTPSQLIVRWDSNQDDSYSSGQQNWVQIQTTPSQKNILLVVQLLAPLTPVQQPWSLTSTLTSLTTGAVSLTTTAVSLTSTAVSLTSNTASFLLKSASFAQYTPEPALQKNTENQDNRILKSDVFEDPSVIQETQETE